MQAKRIISSGLAGALALSMAMPAGVMAETGAANDSIIIDSTKKGSITVHKLIENDGHEAISDGHDVLASGATDSSTDHAVKEQEDGTIDVTNPFIGADSTPTTFDGTEEFDTDLSTEGTEYDENQENAAGVRQSGTEDGIVDGTISVKDDSYIPLDGIVFSYLKIADILNVNGNLADGTSVVGTYFTNLNEGIFGNDASIRNQLAVAAPVPTVIDGQNYYTTASIEKCLADMNAAKTSAGVAGEELLRQFIKANGEAMNKTDKDGKSTKDEMDLGLYILGETDITAHDGLDANGQQYKVEDYRLNPEYPVIESEAAPFLVSLPTTNVSKVNDKAPGTVWEYDIDVFPKDQTNSIVKRIVDPDDSGDRALRIREDYQIGDTIEQVIYADAPALQPYTPHDAINDQLNARDDNANNEAYDEVASYGVGVNKAMKKHEKFVIKDTMSKSLTFDGVSSVKIIPKAVNAQYDTDLGAAGVALVAGEDYVLTQNGAAIDANNALGSKFETDHTFEVTMTAAGLAKLDAITEDSQVVVFFSTTLNDKAQIGPGNLNANNPNLTWKNSNTAEKSVDGNYVYVYTYELDLKKTGVENAENVIFTVTHTDDNNRTVTKGAIADDGSYLYPNASFVDDDDTTAMVQFVKESDGVYHVFDPDHDKAEDLYKLTVNGVEYTNAINPAADGKLVIKGFDSDTYTFKEISTEQGKNLLKSTFDIEFVEDGDPNFTYLNGTSAVAGKEGSAELLQDGKLIRATLSIDEAVAGNADESVSTDDLNLDPQNNGIAKVQIDNYKAVTLRTGGEGRQMIYMGGAAMLGILSAAVIADKKRRIAQ